MTLEDARLPSGILASYAWPGGYPLYYLTQDGGILCPKCANENAKLSGDPHDPQWNVIAYDVNWEDEDLICDHCYKPIKSAYGDVDHNPAEDPKP